ncbi:putative tetratricopeptide-like helical domain superfamily [Helianthus annuus]|nr:putative tetratricopeptide-like helical domain superfamily [Helianthus annuus]
MAKGSFSLPNLTIKLSSISNPKFFSSNNVPESTNPHQQLKNLHTLLQQGQTQSAKTLLKSLITSNSNTTPSHIYTHYPKKSHFFSSFILSVSAESNLPKESLHLYMLIRKDNFFPSLASFNLLLECLVSCGQYVRVLELFDHAVSANIRVDQFTFGKAVQSAVKIGDVRRGIELMDYMRGYGRVMDARKLFDEMLETRVDRVAADKVTFNAMIDGYCKVGDVDEAFRVRDKMKGSNVEANLVTFNTLINGLCRAKRMDEAKKVWEDMKAHGFVPDGFSYSSMFDGFSRSGDLNGLVSLYEQADNDGIRINAYTCGILLNGLCKGGRTNKAEEILVKLLETGLVPTEVIFNTIVDGHCREGNIETALLTLERMKSYRLKPSCVTVNSLINRIVSLVILLRRKNG